MVIWSTPWLNICYFLFYLKFCKNRSAPKPSTRTNYEEMPLFFRLICRTWFYNLMSNINTTITSQQWSVAAKNGHWACLKIRTLLIWCQNWQCYRSRIISKFYVVTINTCSLFFMPRKSVDKHNYTLK